MPQNEDFFTQVYEIVRLVPKGRVTTYGAIVKVLGMARSSRMVGTDLLHAHDPRLNVLAHRVVNLNGLLTGKHHYDTNIQMQQLLESEGITIEDHQVQDFKEVFWDPLTELQAPIPCQNPTIGGAIVTSAGGIKRMGGKLAFSSLLKRSTAYQHNSGVFLT